MSSNPLRLEGKVEAPADRTIERLQQDVRELQTEIASLKTQLVQSQQGNARVIFKLLSPLYKALRPVFGDLDPVSVELGETPAESQTAPQSSAKWDFWKKRFGGRIAEAIDLLLIQGQMNSSQLCHALRCDNRTLAAKVIYPLKKGGLLDKNGGKFSLKQL